MRFSSARNRPRLSPEESVRQGRIVNAARIAFADLDAVRAFLNGHHDGLGGRPLDLAIASDEGLVAVEAVIAGAGAAAATPEEKAA